MSSRRIWVVAVLVAVSLLAASPSARAHDLAPTFSVTDIDGQSLNSTGLLGHVVLLDFSGTWCEPCRIVESGLELIYDEYNASEVPFLSIFIPPLNDVASLEQHRQDYGTPWHLAPDTDTMATRYGVSSLPRVFIIDKEGYLTFNWAPPVGLTAGQVASEVGKALDAALAGTAPPIDLLSLSIPALMAVAALLSFFSPCSFPVLPAFMAYYLNLETKSGKATPRTAAWRGFLASLGMVVVYGLIALVVALAGAAARGVITYLGPVVGVILIILAILTLLPFQYHFLMRPFTALKQKLAARFGGKWEPGVGAKLFAMGAGYGAAGFACVAPVFIGAVLTAATVGQGFQAAIGLFIYVVIVICLMIAITVTLHVAGDRAVRKLSSFSTIMKYVSAAALLIAGGYLLYLFFAASA